jgi:hypothetical protein
MKFFLFPLLLSLLLCGCAAQNPQSEEPVSAISPVITRPEEPRTSTAPSLIPMAAATKQFSLPESATGFLFLDDNLLLFSGVEDSTTLTLNHPESGDTIASYRIPFVLTPKNATVQLLNAGISYFDHSTMETVVLDRNLQEIRRIAAPDDLTGMPLLDQAGRTLYYCTASAVRSLDLDTGISRVLKELSYPVQGLSGILLEDTVLQLSITESDGTWRTLFLSSENGQLLSEHEGNVLPESAEEIFFVRLQDGNLQTLLFGNIRQSPMVLQTKQDPENCFFLAAPDESMSWAGIRRGDLILIRSQSMARSGQLVLCTMDALPPALRRFHLQSGWAIVQAEAPGAIPRMYERSQLESGPLKLLGVALSLQRSLE